MTRGTFTHTTVLIVNNGKTTGACLSSKKENIPCPDLAMRLPSLDKTTGACLVRSVFSKGQFLDLG